MTAKYFCDRCDKELSPSYETFPNNRLRMKIGRFKTEVMTAVDDHWNGGHLCHSCVKEIIAKGKPYK